MPPDKADFAQTNGFKAFPGILLGNPLIQSQSTAALRLFLQNRADIPAVCRQVIPPPPYLSPVTHRDRPCAGFKPQLGKMYHEAGISARRADVRQRYFSPNLPILPRAKSVQVPVWQSRAKAKLMEIQSSNRLSRFPHSIVNISFLTSEQIFLTHSLLQYHF